MQNLTRTIRLFSLLLGGALVVGAIVCLAQTESLTVGPGDQLHVKVLEAPDLEEVARVTDAGTLPLILGGSVEVAGLTPAQAALAVARALAAGHYVLTPHVTVTLEQTATQNVTIMGQVRAPGSYAVGTSRPILDVLALAGGLTDAADRKVTIERHASKQRIDFVFSNSADMALGTSVLVFPGDTIVAPKADVVYILGDVNRPGGYAMVTNDSKLSVIQAMTLAGGTPPNAVPSQTRLIRKRADGTLTEIPLQLSAIEKGKSPDIPLQADDIIYVPFSYMRNIAVGAGSLVGATSSAAIYRF
jgi:polysaccharide export outer membrane protein